MINYFVHCNVYLSLSLGGEKISEGAVLISTERPIQPEDMPELKSQCLQGICKEQGINRGDMGDIEIVITNIIRFPI